MNVDENGWYGILPIPRPAGRTTANPQLSIVIPAFNEAARIGPYLEQIQKYLAVEYPLDAEVLVVDDGSTDRTADLVSELGASWPALRLIRLDRNRGKGAAVRTGVLAASGRRILFADADGATPIAEEKKLARAVAEGAAVVAASRCIEGDGIVRDRNFRREAAGLVFRTATALLVGVGVRDTQCGFKMFDAEAAKRLFGQAREDGYLFDIEVLALARRSGLTIDEVAVSWSEIAGSKVRLVRDSLRMFAGLWRLRRRMTQLPILAPAKKRRAA